MKLAGIFETWDFGHVTMSKYFIFVSLYLRSCRQHGRGITVGVTVGN